MPRENRKRGKKHKKKPEEGNAEPEYQQQDAPESESNAGPSWIVSAPPQKDDSLETDAPFGFIEPDVKAYFRTVDTQIREWQSPESVDTDNQADTDPNSDRHMFFIAALTEMTGKEKQLATDPECSPILERMCYSMDDFVRRVFLDSLTGSCETLMKNRYASHVCQTFFTVAKETISREARGIFPSLSSSAEKGELRTLTQLMLDICDEILPAISSLIMDPFASHVIRALLLLLNLSFASNDSASGSLRSKKSTSWKARHGPMKSVFATDKGKGKEVSPPVSPPEFRTMTHNLLDAFLKSVDDNELRALSIDKVAGPTLNILLEVESKQGFSDISGSLMDRLCDGLVTATHEDSSPMVRPSDFLRSYILDTTTSHLLETIVSCSPDAVFELLWTTYFEDNLRKLALHRVANFVVAKALRRVSFEQLKIACSELDGMWAEAISSARTGVLRAVIERSAGLGVCPPDLHEAVFRALKLNTAEERQLLAVCLLRLHNLDEHTRFKSDEGDVKKHPRRKEEEDPSAPKVQGALLLQALLRLPAPHNQHVIDSINNLSVEEKLDMAHNNAASRVFDALLDSSVVPTQAKRQFVLSFIDSFHLLVDDRIGSRVADRCWAFADTYLKKKIAKTLIPHEQFLTASYYGKFFARNLNLYLLQRRPDEWIEWQSRQKGSGEPSTKEDVTQAVVKVAPESAQKKRKRGAADEIDDLFDTALGKKVKKGALPSEVKPPKVQSPDLKDVMGAIRSAPTQLEKKRRKRG